MKIVNALETPGLVERRAGRDARSNALHLSERGERTMERLIVGLRRSDAAATSPLSADERATLIALLRRVADAPDSDRLPPDLPV